jgi:hypothetical protein
MDMAANLALKRAQKEARRKEAAQRRTASDAIESSMLGRIRKAAAAPIRRCLLHGPIDGISNVIVARGVSPSRCVTAFFLVDTYCLGIKDIILRDLGAEELEILSSAMAISAPLSAIDPAWGRKLVRDAAAWSATIGFPPHRDFATAEQIFGDVNADACSETFVFGHEGRPLYIPGPTETSAQIRQRLTRLRAHFGEDGFDYDGV